MIKSFNLNIVLNPDFSNHTIDNILQFFNNFADGYMLSGAGNGGFLTILLKNSFSKKEIIPIFNKHFHNSNIKIYDFNLIL